MAAFLGALFSGVSAVIVVAVSDWWRDKRLIRIIKAEVALGREHARHKLETARRKRNAIHADNKILGGAVLTFDVAVVRELKARVLHLLDPRQRLALDAVLFRMEGIDGLFHEVSRREDALRDMPDKNRGEGVRAIASALGETITNLRILDDMATQYVAGNYEAITERKFRHGDYSDDPS